MDRTYLEKCGVKLPDDLASTECDDSASANPSWSLQGDAPDTDPSSTFYYRGVQSYLKKCGVVMPDDLAEIHSSAGASANPAWARDRLILS